MAAFATPLELAQSFVKSYYTKAVHQVEELFRFYAPDATVIRGGIAHSPKFDIKATRIVSLNLPPAAFLTVASYTAVLRADGVFLTVAGAIQADDDPANFAQTFLLQLIDTKYWVTLDALVVFDAAFGRDDASFRVADGSAPPKKPKERPPPPPPGERPGSGRKERGKKEKPRAPPPEPKGGKRAKKLKAEREDGEK
jgi:hypothetical protein